MTRPIRTKLPHVVAKWGDDKRLKEVDDGLLAMLVWDGAESLEDARLVSELARRGLRRILHASNKCLKEAKEKTALAWHKSVDKQAREKLLEEAEELRELSEIPHEQLNHFAKAIETGRRLRKESVGSYAQARELWRKEQAQADIPKSPPPAAVPVESVLDEQKKDEETMLAVQSNRERRIVESAAAKTRLAAVP